MDKPLLVFPLMCLNKLGFIRPTENLKNIILKGVVLLILASSAVASIVNYFLYFKGDIFQLIDNMEGIVVSLQAFFKLICFVCLKSKILKLIESTQKLWKSDNCSESTKEEVTSITTVTLILQKMYLGVSIFLIFVDLVPLSYMQRKLPMGTFDMSERNLFYNIDWFVSSLALISASITFASVDGIMLGFFYTTILQFKILGDHLKKLDVEIIDSKDQFLTYKAKLESYIEHQRYLLRFVKELQDICAYIFTVQYIAAAPGMCSEFYATTKSDNIWRVIEHAASSIELTLQLCFYCIPADYLVKEMSKIADAIYSSNWYGNHFIVLKKATQLIIQRAQRETRFTAFGIVDMNTQTLITLVRISFSICTFLRNLDHLKY